MRTQSFWAGAGWLLTWITRVGPVITVVAFSVYPTNRACGDSGGHRQSDGHGSGWNLAGLESGLHLIPPGFQCANPGRVRPVHWATGGAND